MLRRVVICPSVRLACRDRQTSLGGGTLLLTNEGPKRRCRKLKEASV